MEKNEETSLSVIWVNRIRDVRQDAWDALAVGLATPLLEWEWLNQMEASGSIAPENGWQPSHLTVWDGERLVGAAPLYIKSDSEGEFVFDHIWAEVAMKLGIRYYPRLVGMSPVTPVTGYRFLIAEGTDEDRITRRMLDETDRFCREKKLGGCSFLFADPEWRRRLSQLGCITWLHHGFVWENPGFQCFDDYLSRFNANQRRNIRRERRAMARQGISFRAFCGDEIPRHFIPLLYRFYERTNEQHGPWGCRYLNQKFFEGLYGHYRHRMVLIAAFRDSVPEPVGMSMLLHKGQQLLGRYWGCTVRADALHFNACYYQPIEWAIRHGVRFFNPGAGGEHKIRRGFGSFGCYSLHRFYDRRMELVMRAHIREVNRAEKNHIAHLNTLLPFSRKPDSGCWE
ncbi:N-acetyltransferase [Desulfonema ishimotonii]|uniref:N-acetyltransferase n=1 Tax=Desulfonema ishimotonii TaxID=45657 RepID=A0A401FV68_9BACT|nr:GNAT family N-acetyltransferase [Desulfonema ishimotonii]GBC60848.1 N-acetyltransferase [Desulfonema ishimotonii]